MKKEKKKKTQAYTVSFPPARCSCNY